MSKYSRAGKKFTGNHTSLIPVATIICDIAHNCPFVTKISPGFITQGLRSVNGIRRVKITIQEGCLLLAVRDNTSMQELRIYTTDTITSKKTILVGAEDNNMKVTFS